MIGVTLLAVLRVDTRVVGDGQASGGLGFLRGVTGKGTFLHSVVLLLSDSPVAVRKTFSLAGLRRAFRGDRRTEVSWKENLNYNCYLS